MSDCNVIAIVNQKGGTGKSTTAVNLSAALALRGKKVICVDADAQGDATTSLGYDPDNLQTTLADVLEKSMADDIQDYSEGILHHPEGFDLMPANIELSGMEMMLVTTMSREQVMRNWLDMVKDNYDYAIIDCMPSLGMITVNALAAADNVIIPVQSHYLPAKGMVQLIKTVNKVKRQINPDLKIQGILLTLVDNRTNIARNTIQGIRETYGAHIPIFKTEIPLAVAAAETAMTGKSLFSYDPASKVARAYSEFAKEVDNAAKTRHQNKADLSR
jgi:chromosome partitioning protein